MIYFLEEDRLEAQKSNQIDSVDFRPCLGILDEKEMKQWKEYLDISPIVIKELFQKEECKFERYDGFDYINLLIPNPDDLKGSKLCIAIYFRNNQLLFLFKDEKGKQILNQMLNVVTKKGNKSFSLGGILYEFFDLLTEGDAIYLKAIEQEIFEMEQELIQSLKSDYIQQSVSLRRKLLEWKRYYEQLLHIEQDIEENKNGLLSNHMADAFHRLTGRTIRLMDRVVNLKEYAWQIGEVYQAQVGIKENEIRTFFTVITAIFLPLTFLVGWYGMNLKMPEFRFAFAYPVVVLISAGVAICSYLYLKKKKWF